MKSCIYTDIKITKALNCRTSDILQPERYVNLKTEKKTWFYC